MSVRHVAPPLGAVVGVILLSAPEAFRGRVRIGDGGAHGASYAVVPDGQRFILLRSSALLRVCGGRA